MLHYICYISHVTEANKICAQIVAHYLFLWKVGTIIPHTFIHPPFVLGAKIVQEKRGYA